ncbi:class I adenylate-forming enzyme family protein [Roseibium porphyridii]|uniref:Class I adenylate-forming enzyme family protein n=1 Tax=Roseibium porphyridii TaxID=2866279 RepID=A0ABY8F5L2_9HYPH|nr:class I adenylate-forming enzyme family protein [Roseibium sp. KMA01]WFE89357.1 class I adenylate-forming enzyme family protein [Roseibium sp. KMA01]
MMRSSFFDKIRAAAERETVVSLIDDRSVTGSQLLHAADCVAAHLTGLGAAPQSRVLAVLPNGLALLVLYVSCLRHRFVVCPVSPDSPQQDIDYIRSVYRPDVTVDPAALEACLREALEETPATPVLPEDVAYDERDIFSVNFTSGTTGRPKGVAHFAEQILANADAFNSQFGCHEDQRMMHVMPMYYMAGLLNTILCPLMTGGAVVVAPALLPRTALSFWRQFIDNGATAFWLSPTMLRMVMKLDRTKDSKTYAAENLRHAFVGTAPMAPALGQEFLDGYGVRPLQSYGLSELLLVSCDDTAAGTFGGVGMTLSGISIHLAEDHELQISTPYLFAGYLDPDSGAIDFADRQKPFDSGDLAEIDAHSRLRITGRKKDLVVVGGINVSPAAIEERLQAVAGVTDIAVVGECDDVYGEVPVAFVQLEAGAEEAAVLDMLRAGAQDQLPAASRPARYYMVEKMPTGPTGKVQKRLLKRPDVS